MLAQLAGASTQEFELAWPNVSKNFIQRDGDPARLTNRVVEDELRRRAEKVVAGRSGGRPRKKPDGYQTKTKSESEIQTETKGKKNTHPLSRVLGPHERERLSEFLKLYPKKTHQEKAKRAYASIIDTESMHAELIDGLNRWVHSEQWTASLYSDGGRFVPDPDKFLEDRLWQDHPPVRPANPMHAYLEIEGALRKRKPSRQ